MVEDWFLGWVSVNSNTWHKILDCECLWSHTVPTSLSLSVTRPSVKWHAHDTWLNDASLSPTFLVWWQPCLSFHPTQKTNAPTERKVNKTSSKKRYAWCWVALTTHLPSAWIWTRALVESWYKRNTIAVSSTRLSLLVSLSISLSSLSLFLSSSCCPSDHLKWIVHNSFLWFATPLAPDLMSNYPHVARDKFFHSGINALCESPVVSLNKLLWYTFLFFFYSNAADAVIKCHTKELFLFS